MMTDVSVPQTSPSASARYFDGRSSARHDVRVTLGADALVIRDVAGREIAQWPYARVEQISNIDGVLRLGNGDRDTLARLELHDAEFAAALDAIAVTVDRTGAREKTMRRKVALLSIGALAALAFVSLAALPEIVARLTPMLPLGIERKLGDAVDTQFRAMAATARGTLDCGVAPSEAAGRAAFDALFARLARAAHLPEDLRATVIRRDDTNAVALPGGRIYVFAGLIAKAESADELAGVIAHELGHVARRDGLRSVLESAGLSFVLGTLLGDFVGGGAVMIAARTMLHASYSRDTEAQADRFAVAVVNATGGDARALAALLTRIDNTHEDAASLLRDHPQTKDRAAAIRALAATPPSAPMMSASDWAALKTICSGQ